MPDAAPLLTATPPIAGHAIAAFSAFALGLSQFALPKGGSRHRVAGWLWVALMAYMALSGLFIHEIRLWGRFSPIHLLSFTTLAGLWVAIHYARKGNIAAHRRVMRLIFWTALGIAGAFTFLPGRIMHAVVTAP